jgi:ATP-dependent Clp protease ATP-binding subunit ClpA
MFEKFTSVAREAVTGAVREAQQQGATHVTSEHMLLALVDDTSTDAGHLMAEHGVTRTEIVTAFQEARRRGGLSESDTEALRELGINVSDVIDKVENSLGPDALSAEPPKRRRGFLAPRNHIPFSSEAKQVLERTLREAIDFGSRRLGDEHILLALVAQGGVVSEVLGKKGLTYDALRARLGRAQAS